MLNRLIEYTRTNIPKSEPGFTVRDIRWRIELAKDGELSGIIPLGDEQSGTERWGCPEMHGMNSGGKAHFLVDNLKTALLLKAASNDLARHDFYLARIRDASAVAAQLKILLAFIENTAAMDSLRKILSASPYRADPKENLCWIVDGYDPLDDQVVMDWWRHWRKCGHDEAESEHEMLCFASGTPVEPATTHPMVMRLPGGQGSGAALIGFDKTAFTSFGLKKSANASVSEQSARAYVDALNHLVRHRSKKLGDALALYWFKGKVEDKDDVLAWLQDPPEVAAASAALTAKKLFDAIRNGQRPDLASNEFYALTASGMAARVMVRDWMEGQFENLVANIEAWFSDLAIITRDGNGLAHDPKFMAVCGSLVRELKDLPAPTAATLWKVAVQNLPIPQPLMAQALARFRADHIKDEPFSHARMGLIRAYFVRLQPGGDIAMTAYLNPDHPAPAYHCGRLLAIFANLQYAALGDVGAGVVQRYYASASQTPGLVIGRLATNARNHLGKLDGKQAREYEEKIADVMSRLGDAAPRTLDLNGQGLFALGYYQQLAKLRA